MNIETSRDVDGGRQQRSSQQSNHQPIETHDFEYNDPKYYLQRRKAKKTKKKKARVILSNTRSIMKSLTADLSLFVFLSLALAIVTVYICDYYDILWEIHISLVVVPIVFPLAFSINASYQRREKVLEDFALFKSSASELYLCHRDWSRGSNIPHSHSEEVRKLLRALLDTVIGFCRHGSSTNRFGKLRKFYRIIHRLSLRNTSILRSNITASSPLVSRLVHYHAEMQRAFENIRNIREYTTPRSIRYYYKFFVFLSPALLAPYFVFLSRDIDGLSEPSTSWSPYYSAVIMSLLYGALQAVNDGLDDPFDGFGEDDIQLHAMAAWPTIAMFRDIRSMPEKHDLFKNQQLDEDAIRSECTESSGQEDDEGLKWPDGVPQTGPVPVRKGHKRVSPHRHLATRTSPLASHVRIDDDDYEEDVNVGQSKRRTPPSTIKKQRKPASKQTHIPRSSFQNGSSNAGSRLKLGHVALGTDVVPILDADATKMTKVKEKALDLDTNDEFQDDDFNIDNSGIQLHDMMSQTSQPDFHETTVFPIHGADHSSLMENHGVMELEASPSNSMFMSPYHGNSAVTNIDGNAVLSDHVDHDDNDFNDVQTEKNLSHQLASFNKDFPPQAAPQINLTSEPAVPVTPPADVEPRRHHSMDNRLVIRSLAEETEPGSTSVSRSNSPPLAPIAKRAQNRLSAFEPVEKKKFDPEFSSAPPEVITDFKPDNSSADKAPFKSKSEGGYIAKPVRKRTFTETSETNEKAFRDSDGEFDVEKFAQARDLDMETAIICSYLPKGNIALSEKVSSTLKNRNMRLEEHDDDVGNGEEVDYIDNDDDDEYGEDSPNYMDDNENIDQFVDESEAKSDLSSSKRSSFASAIHQVMNQQRVIRGFSVAETTGHAYLSLDSSELESARERTSSGDVLD